MKYILREIENHIKNNLFKGKIIIVYGPRQVGKTTMIKHLVSGMSQVEYYSCDNIETRSKLQNANEKELGDFVHGKKLIVIDEAQLVSDIGLTLKLMHDTHPDVQIIASGSSSFELANKTKEPLTGRSIEYVLLPLSFKEISNFTSIQQADDTISLGLIYGMYPGILFGEIDRKELLGTIASQYLYKDILKFEGLRMPMVLEKILKVLAISVGQEVSYEEIANSVDANRKTVETYIGYLEQAFIVYRLLPFSTNIRSQISKKQKILFYDVGMRNAILGLFSDIDVRTDKGGLWENFIITERKKVMQNSRDIFAKQYFLRTYDGQEVDLVEEWEGGHIQAFEIKYTEARIHREPAIWKKNFPSIPVKIITRKNAKDFLK
ncbi:ATP-binding protein [Candidatus Nomurabacteria bacterium]|nr:ATP-binding protein [Candidatus Nomurabacteria bacterium]